MQITRMPQDDPSNQPDSLSPITLGDVVGGPFDIIVSSEPDVGSIQHAVALDPKLANFRIAAMSALTMGDRDVQATLYDTIEVPPYWLQDLTDKDLFVVMDIDFMPASLQLELLYSLVTKNLGYGYTIPDTVTCVAVTSKNPNDLIAKMAAADIVGTCKIVEFPLTTTESLIEAILTS